MEILKGIPVSPGFAFAEAFILDSHESVIPSRFIQEDEVQEEIERFHQAVAHAIDEIRDIQNRVLKEELGPEAGPIFDAHIMILSDKSLHQEVLHRIRNNRFTAEYAISRSMRKAEKAFRQIENAYLAQRMADLRDIETRLLNALLGDRKEELATIDHDVILLARDLSPSQTATLDRTRIKGFATDAGGMTGHTAIIARAREIPAVVGLGTVSTDVSTGDKLIIDGHRGIIVVNPDESTVQDYRRISSEFDQFEAAVFDEKDLPAETSDGCRVTVLANIEFPAEISDVLRCGGEGVGLYRTEFLYVGAETEPGEAEHYAAYASAIEDIGGLPLTIRTIDLGADKFFHEELHRGSKRDVNWSFLHERNPALGCRAVRYCLLRPETLRQQVRAICRMSVHENIKMLVPMVSCREEVLNVRQIVTEVQVQLSDEGIAYNPDMPFGIMVEVPSVALTLDAYGDICDFFSIGTNDLIQYLMAADRTNEHVANLYRPGHPAVIRLIKQIIDAGKRMNIPVSLCGEMAGDPNFVVLLLGLGLRNFSVSPPLIPEVKKIIRSMNLAAAKAIAEDVLTMTTAREIVSHLRRATKELQLEWSPVDGD